MREMARSPNREKSGEIALKPSSCRYLLKKITLKNGDLCKKKKKNLVLLIIYYFLIIIKKKSL